MTDIEARLHDLSTRVSRFESRELLVEAAERIAELERRQIPPSWSSPDGTEWSGLSGGGVVDVRGSKADIDVVQSWRHAKDRLAWFEEEYKRSLERQAEDDFKTRQASEAYFELQARYDRLLAAFHDATRRPLSITPDSGEEFYDARMADEAEARRTRYGRGIK